MFKVIVICIFIGLALSLKQAWNANMDVARGMLRPLKQEEEWAKQGRIQERTHFLKRIAVARAHTVDVEQRMLAQNLAHVAVLILLFVVLPLTSWIFWLFLLITFVRSFLVWVARNHTRRVEGIANRLSPEDQTEVGRLRHIETVRLRMKKE